MSDSNKKRKIELDESSRIVDLFHPEGASIPEVCIDEIAIEMHGRLYILLGNDTISLYDGKRFVRSITLSGLIGSSVRHMKVGTSDKIDEESLIESNKVPELYAFPPGVLPIYLAYLGSDILYVSDGIDGVCVYDNNGIFIRRIKGKVTNFTIDAKGGIHILNNGSYKICSYSSDAKLISSYESPVNIDRVESIGMDLYISSYGYIEAAIGQRAGNFLRTLRIRDGVYQHNEDVDSPDAYLYYGRDGTIFAYDMDDKVLSRYNDKCVLLRSYKLPCDIPRVIDGIVWNDRTVFLHALAIQSICVVLLL
jgi:hypothetical protein